MSNHKLNGISLALNAGLAAICVFLALRLSSRPAAPIPLEAPAEPSSDRVIAESRHAASVARGNPDRAAQRNWIEVLRTEGVPEKVLARLVLAEFEDRWQSRQAQAQQAYNRGDLDADGLAALAREHDLEQEKDLRARLGPEAFRSWDQEQLFQPFNLNNLVLTASETNSLYELAANLRQRLRNLDKAREENEIDQATLNTEQAKAQAEFEKQLRALLGDERSGALRGENPTAGELRRGLRGLTVDDQQFTTLLQAQEQWDSARAQLEQQQVESGDTHLQPQINALTEKRDQAFASVLGTDGFALFQKQQDSRFLEMQKNAARWGLDGSTIDDIYNAIQTYEKAAGDYERNVREIETQIIRVDRDVLHQNLQTYARQLAQVLRANLGDARYDAIRNNQLLPFDQ